ncbi:MAG: 50S ribosomal protein L21 [Microgenomates group bacterium]|jgi:large subunit ribosomal protein L21|nr:50S ribosomal protein L21 [Candidatus Woesebacteria bacterium]MBP6882948.1 50S ribosomal protein L21 [Candidatus Woesebacteria bacterium]QQR63432.1 MAG: 50S ribosomal protein L21 [Candidatus Roizmanbacteria bacterium]
MSVKAVVTTGGKQYLVGENEEITVEHLEGNLNDQIKLKTLAIFDSEKDTVELGTPELKKEAAATIVEQGKGEKIRVAKFRAKSRYRKVTGFRPVLTKLKISKIS